MLQFIYLLAAPNEKAQRGLTLIAKTLQVFHEISVKIHRIERR